MICTYMQAVAIQTEGAAARRPKITKLQTASREDPPSRFSTINLYLASLMSDIPLR
jgi:hypothetical protein